MCDGPDERVTMAVDVDVPGVGGRRLAERVVREAGLSPAVLPDASEPEDPYLAAYVLAMGAVLERATMAGVAEDQWALRLRVALRALLAELSGCPQLARACSVVEERFDGRARASRDAVLERLESVIWPAVEELGQVEARRAGVLADGVLNVIGRTVQAESAAALPALLVQLHWWAVALRAS